MGCSLIAGSHRPLGHVNHVVLPIGWRVRDSVNCAASLHFMPAWMIGSRYLLGIHCSSVPLARKSGVVFWLTISEATSECLPGWVTVNSSNRASSTNHFLPFRHTH